MEPSSLTFALVSSQSTTFAWIKRRKGSRRRWWHSGDNDDTMMLATFKSRSRATNSTSNNSRFGCWGAECLSPSWELQFWKCRREGGYGLQFVGTCQHFWRSIQLLYTCFTIGLTSSRVFQLVDYKIREGCFSTFQLSWLQWTGFARDYLSNVAWWVWHIWHLGSRWREVVHSEPWLSLVICTGPFKDSPAKRGCQSQLRGA